MNYTIVDNFLEDPNAIRNVALSAEFPITGNFPGKRSYQCDRLYNDTIKKKLEFILNKKITDWFDHYDKNTDKIENVDTSCFQICLKDDKTWVHYDPNEYTAILYLTPNAPIEAGTGIYRHIESGIYRYFEDNIIDDSDLNSWEIITFVGNIFNRLLIFKGCLYHRSVLPGFGFDKYTGRLTQTFFFNTEEYSIRKKNGNT